MRTTVRLPEDLLRRVRNKAHREGRTLTSLIEEGLRLVLSDTNQIRRKHVQLPVSKASGGTLPGVDLNRSSDLTDVMES